MLSFTSQQLLAWVAAFIWPFCRIIGLIAVAPIFGHSSVPARVKVGLATIITVIITPVLPVIPNADPFSMAGVIILVQQFILGTAMGFSMTLIFTAIEYAGELMGSTMGLGFASFFDPHTQGHTSAIGQFLAILLFMLYLATDTHLLLLATLVDSFNTFPIGTSVFRSKGFLDIINWAGSIFSIGLQIALPIIGAMLIANLALAILTRAAPQLNLFGIGFPILLMTGFAVLVMALPYFLPTLFKWLESSFAFAQKIPLILNSRTTTN